MGAKFMLLGAKTFPGENISGESGDTQPSDSGVPGVVSRTRGATCVLTFAIGVFIQLSLPLTDLYQTPNVRGAFFAFIVAAFIFLFLTGKPIRVRSSLLMSYMALGIFLAVGILYSRAPVYGATKTILVVSYFWALGTVIYNLVDDISVAKAFLNGLVVGGLLLIGITAMAFGNPIDMISGANRYFRLRFGEEGNPIMLARHLALAITMLVTYVAVRRRWMDLLWSLPISVLGFIYLIATGSKGPLLALIASFICAPILLIKGVVARMSVALLVGGFFFVAVIGILEVLPTGFIQERFVEKVENLSLRLPAYKDAMNAIVTSDPLALVIGHGTGDFGYLDLGKDGRAYPHNVLLEVAYENGLVGLSLLVIAFACPLIALMRAAQQQLSVSHRVLLAGLSASYIAAVVNAQFSGDLGANLFIGMFGAATVSVARFEAQHCSDA
jgi:O-antigen ligase